MLKRFWGAFVSLGVVVGLVAAADQLNIVRWVIATILLALMVVVSPSVIRAARARFQAYRERPALLARVEEAAERTSQGIAEGRAQVLGALLAAAAGVPSVVSIRLTEHNQLRLCGKVSPGAFCPSIGARYVMYAEGQENWPVGACSVVEIVRGGA